MKLFPLELAKNTDELKKLISENPELPIVVLAGQDSTDGEQAQKVAIDKAIEIVKQGGVSDDVCEWKMVRDGEFIQNPHTNRLYSNEPSMNNVYCNTCGKKIKAVI